MVVFVGGYDSPTEPSLHGFEFVQQFEKLSLLLVIQRFIMAFGGQFEDPSNCR